MTILKSNIDKAEIAEMETACFGGRIIVLQSPGEAEKAVRYLMGQSYVGIDTETRPSFRRGKSFAVSLLQVSTDDTCFLFRLPQTGFTEGIKQFFQASAPVKIGLSLRDDFARLHTSCDFEPHGYLELQQSVAQMGIEAQSLQKVFAILFGQRISKSQRLSNWEADVLTDAQKLYAATDAWACVRIYEELQRLQAEGYSVENPKSIVSFE